MVCVCVLRSGRCFGIVDFPGSGGLGFSGFWGFLGTFDFCDCCRVDIICVRLEIWGFSGCIVCYELVIWVWAWCFEVFGCTWAGVFGGFWGFLGTFNFCGYCRVGII